MTNWAYLAASANAAVFLSLTDLQVRFGLLLTKLLKHKKNSNLLYYNHSVLQKCMLASNNKPSQVLLSLYFFQEFPKIVSLEMLKKEIASFIYIDDIKYSCEILIRHLVYCIAFVLYTVQYLDQLWTIMFDFITCTHLLFALSCPNVKTL